MADPKYNFQYCQKIVLFSADWQKVLLARRHGEADYDGTFSFIGGKMEATDGSFLEGLRREKNEEIGEAAKVRIHLGATHNLLFQKRDGSAMVLPHYLAQYVGGDIQLSPTEYSEYQWVDLNALDALEPKIETIPECVQWAQAVRTAVAASDFVEI